MFVVGFELFEIMEPKSCHVLVSLAHVVRIVDQSTAKATLTVLVIEVVGLDVFTSAILDVIYTSHCHS